MEQPQPDPDAIEEIRRSEHFSHELRTPLTIVVGRVQLLQRRVRRGEIDGVRIEADLDAIETALARLIAALLRSGREQ